MLSDCVMLILLASTETVQVKEKDSERMQRTISAVVEQVKISSVDTATQLLDEYEAFITDPFNAELAAQLPAALSSSRAAVEVALLQQFGLHQNEEGGQLWQQVQLTVKEEVDAMFSSLQQQIQGAKGMQYNVICFFLYYLISYDTIIYTY